MEVIEYVEKLDNTFTNITKDYKYIYDNIHNYINDGKVSYNQLMDFEVSLEDLSIQINTLAFLFKQKEIEKQNLININFKESTYKETKLDYIIEKTIFQYIPLLFIYFMIFDNESILYVKDFIEKNKYENKNSNISYDNINKKSEFQFIIEPIDD